MSKNTGKENSEKKPEILLKSGPSDERNWVRLMVGRNAGKGGGLRFFIENRQGGRRRTRVFKLPWTNLR